MSQKNESKWWFEKLLNCKHEDDCGEMGFNFMFHGLHVCRYTFYEIHGFRGDRRRISSRSKKFEAMINAGYSHAPNKSHSGPVSLKGDVARHWIWRHIKFQGLPNPNATGVSGTVCLQHNDVNERYQLYVKDMTADGKKAFNKAYVLTYNSFRRARNKQWELGWVSEQQKHFELKNWEIADRSGMRVCRTCSECFENLVKAKTVDARVAERNEL